MTTLRSSICWCRWSGKRHRDPRPSLRRKRWTSRRPASTSRASEVPPGHEPQPLDGHEGLQRDRPDVRSPGRHEEAVAAFEEAIKAQREAGGKQTAVASVHMNLGILLDRMKKPKEPRSSSPKRPSGSGSSWTRIRVRRRLGLVRGHAGHDGRLQTGVERIREGRGPGAVESQSLPEAGPGAGIPERYDEAIVVVRKHIELMQEQGKREIATELSQYVEFLEYQKAKQAR